MSGCSLASAARWPLLAGLLLSAMVVANQADRLIVGPNYSELLKDDIHDRGADWRPPPIPDSEWRAPKPDRPSRIHLGYDSLYEQLNARESAGKPPHEMDRTRPNTLLRIEF